MPGLRPSRWRPALAAIGSLAAISGCAYALIEDGVIREGPMRDIVENTVRARGIEPEGPIAARSVNRDELRAILAEAFGQWKTPAELADYERAIELDAFPIQTPYYNKALTLIKLKRKEEARQTLEEALEVVPGSPKIVRKLAELDDL